MKIIRCLLFSLLCLQFYHCSPDVVVEMEYEETYCADKWGINFSSDDEVIKAIQDYFDDEYNIVFEDIRFSSTGKTPDACRACNCKSGRIISASVDEAFQDEMESEGFVLK